MNLNFVNGLLNIINIYLYFFQSFLKEKLPVIDRQRKYSSEVILFAFTRAEDAPTPAFPAHKPPSAM